MATADQRQRSPPALRNRLLAALPPPDLARLWPQLEPVALLVPQILYAAGQPIPAVHFIETGWVSKVARLEGGDLAEVGLVGREGMVGLSLALGADAASTEAMVQGTGTALRMDAAAFGDALAGSAALHRLLLRYALAFQAQVAQTAACNGRHRLEERLARWLLMAHDRADGDDLPLTQDFLSMMLGVRRSGVTIAAGILQKAGLIRYVRGRIAVLDRPGLEAAACECHAAVRREHARLLPDAGNAPRTRG
ncbi:MAG: cAMP-binding proteins - catabolite gene activator and regulatory subunit of cAMP-dependent protein kinases [uncultured Acetobacteraceae bacterium]|uniref:cAMP-binding proteins - catabolite gene activator and regulatory subunit of cAMP-dependent protein kinases n=1 Tax=uncultured Acetobacteraceae bacterium TaxID=169975 RepID=A0A6J4J7Y6_9PROT|nr:MAG: cAMP-binding proteins - catabolite gene activator and regulatory subunit of cAMP-dependent protein kinases [uncultured Acetobacteraceae bacterium]